MTAHRTTGVFVAATLAAVAGAQSQCQWELFETPTITARKHILFGIDGLANDSVWAVGWAQTADSDTLTLAMHFDGVEWTAHQTPNPSVVRGFNILGGVVAFARDDVIAVGTQNPDSGGASQTLAMRFDGSDWDLIDSPVIEGGSSYDGISRAGEDTWAFGSRRWGVAPPAAGAIALATRWTGSGWEEEFVPPLAALGGRSYNHLRALHGASADDIWAVGVAQQTGSNDPFGPRTYMVRWDGNEWSLVDFPFGNQSFSGLADVHAIANDDVYAVGWTLTDNGTQPLIAHFDGGDWTLEDLPHFPDGSAELRAVTARSSDEVYAFGTYADADGTPRDLILRYDGAQWERMPGAMGTENEWFRAALTLPSAQIWAVGQQLDWSALTERLDCTPGEDCAADIDGDGDADADDFFQYLDLFANDDARADIDADGDIDADDFFDYLDLFAAGC